MLEPQQLEIQASDGWITFAVRVIPRAARNDIVGVQAGAVKIRLAAPPVDGAANDALVRMLAKALGLAPTEVEIVRGHTSRTKLLRVPNNYEERLRQLVLTV